MPEGYTRLAQLLDQNDKERGTGGNRLFYLSTAPSDYPEIIRQLGAAGLNRPGRRVAIGPASSSRSRSAVTWNPLAS